MEKTRAYGFLLAILLLFCHPASAVDRDAVDRLVSARNVDIAAIQWHGREVLPLLAELYRETDSPKGAPGSPGSSTNWAGKAVMPKTQ